jgi:hypothetical protein
MPVMSESEWTRATHVPSGYAHEGKQSISHLPAILTQQHHDLCLVVEPCVHPLCV